MRADLMSPVNWREQMQEVVSVNEIESLLQILSLSGMALQYRAVIGGEKHWR